VNKKMSEPVPLAIGFLGHRLLPSSRIQRHANKFDIWFNRRILKFYAKLNENGTMNLRR